MKYLVTSEEMKKYDNNTIEKIGIPGMVLMERAALAVLEEITKRFGGKNTANISVLVLAGVGNNGGDGLALARLLTEKGIHTDVWCVGSRDKASCQWKQQREILRHYSVSIGSKAPDSEYTILVDALFGVGLSREVGGEYAKAIENFNQRNGYRIAIDVPSGLNADTGKVAGCAVRADLTVTFGFCKRGLVLYPGCEYTGRVVIADIGITERSFFGEKPDMFYYDEPVGNLLPVRAADGNKGTFGKVLLVAGSVNMAGAAVLAAKAAYRAGAGMVKVITPSENRVILQGTVPEALLGTAEDLEESLKWADVAAVGPGIGKSEEAKEALRIAICESRLPLLIDADGLNLLAEDSKLQHKLSVREGNVILTPHVGELARLTGESIASLKEDLTFFAKKLAERLHAVVAAKDARTFICTENSATCVNIRGNSGMATAGSGDVLAGVIAGLSAQGMKAFEAASVGVYVHALAGEYAAGSYGKHAAGSLGGYAAESLGEYAAQSLGEYAVMAGDIAEKVMLPMPETDVRYREAGVRYEE